MDDYSETILECLAIGDRSISVDELQILVAQRRGTRLDVERFDSALGELIGANEVKKHGVSLKRVEPDASEFELEGPTILHLKSGFAETLGLDPSECVVENTARGGAYGAGRWSRPDFTMAAIRRWRFDPRRQLDVFTIELKNRAGTNLLAVHEALAHARFAHFPYLACPRPGRPQDLQRIRQECAEHGVGLISFRLGYANGQLRVDQFEHDLEAVRHASDPERIQEYLNERLSIEAQNQLETIAWGCSPSAPMRQIG